jgi:enterochelin esterase-like enzyme
MKKCMLIVFTLLPVLLCAQGTVIDTFFYSNALAHECSMMVYLPDGYDTSTIDYPVIYVLHGATQNWNSNPMVFDTVDALIDEQIINPIIVVHPQGSAPPYLGSWYANSALYGNYETCISVDLIEFIDTTFRTTAERNQRSVMGFSMGGYGAMKLGLKYPDVYRAVASHSGAIDHKVYFPYWVPHILQENGNTPPYNYTYGSGIYTNLAFSIAGAYSPDTTDPPYYIDFPLDSLGNIIDSVWLKWDFHYLPILAAQLPPGNDLSIYFDCGTQDELFFYQSSMAFADTLDSLGINYEFQSYFGTHQSGILGRLRTSISFLDSVMQIGINEDAGYMIHDTRYNLTIVPNPFAKLTKVSFSIEPSAKRTEVRIYDVVGRLVRDLYCAMPHAPCAMQISWDGTDQANRQLGSGVYFVKFVSGDYEETEKVLLVR